MERKQGAGWTVILEARDGFQGSCSSPGKWPAPRPELAGENGQDRCLRGRTSRPPNLGKILPKKGNGIHFVPLEY